jgi:hypothetical protein
MKSATSAVADKMAAEARKRTSNSKNMRINTNCDTSDLNYLESVNKIRLQINIRIVLISITLLTACGVTHIKPDT